MERERTSEEWFFQVKQNGWAIEFIPEELKTIEMCLEAVEQNGLFIQFVPEKLRTFEVCLAAVKEDGIVLIQIPNNFKTLEMCLEALKARTWSPSAREMIIRFMPKEFCNLFIVKHYINRPWTA